VINPLRDDYSRKYFAGFLIIALLATAGYFVLYRIISTEESSAAVINISGRQRMLCVRTAFYATRLVNETSEEKASVIRKKLLQTADTLKKNLHNLTSGSTFNLDEETKRNMRKIYDGSPIYLSRQILEFINDVEIIADLPFRKNNRENQSFRHVIGTADGRLIDSLDMAVAKYQEMSESKIALTKKMGFIVLMMIIFTMAMVNAFIFSPMQETIKEKMHSLILGEKKLCDITTAIGEGVCVTDRTGVCTFVNPKACEMLGWNKNELLGKPLHTIDTGMGTENVLRLDKDVAMVIQSGKEIRADDDKFHKKDGSPLEVSYVISPLMGDLDMTGAVLVFHDISRQKRDAKSLREAMEKAEEATKLKNRFLDLVTHDLKTPITTIHGFLKYINKMCGENISSQNREMLEKSIDIALRMNTMVDELLNISRFKDGKISHHFKFTDLSYLLEEVLAMHGYVAKLKGVMLVNDVPRNTRIYTDAVLYNEVLYNLVSNAIKFSNAGGTVRLHLLKENPNVVAVTDNGVGIENNRLESILSDQETTSTIGTDKERGFGYGLPLSKMLMESMGGLLTVESKIGEGSSFYLEMPLVKPRILLVEAVKSSLQALENMLAGLEAGIERVVTGTEAVASMKDSIPHLVVAELNMEGMNGLELMEFMKTEKPTAETPILIVLEDATDIERQVVFNMDVSGVIEKSWTADILIPHIRKYIS